VLKFGFFLNNDDETTTIFSSDNMLCNSSGVLFFVSGTNSVINNVKMIDKTPNMRNEYKPMAL
jgi:hypothetical protein